jgi:SWI/SNF-related matrix-associated actin-dependent regulator 1 of chromatin subfamily A
MVVCDEAHYIKNQNSQRSKAALPVLQNAKRTVLLTGTPALSRPSELITLLQALLPESKIKAQEFANRYCQGNKFSPYHGAQNQVRST